MTVDLGISRSSLFLLGFVLFLTLKFIRAYHEKSKLDHIPTLGPNGLLSSYITVFRWITKATEIVEEGYRTYPGGIYKIPTMDGWQVIVNGTKMVDDIRKATDEQMSNEAANNDSLKVEYTIHPQVAPNPYHIDVIRTPLTRNIGARFADIHDEIQKVISEKIPVTEDWIEIHAHETVLDIIVRAVNRFFVGLPLCREPDWCDLNIKFTLDVVVNSMIINLFPKFTHPIVGRIFTGRKSAMRRTKRHLKSIIEERLRLREQFGKDWPDKPASIVVRCNLSSDIFPQNDFIQWSMDAEQNAPLSQRTSLEDLCIRLLSVNFGAVHTTSLAFTYALYHLASRPELAEPLRKEVQTVVEKEGWSKVGMVQMRLLDSFLKESERLNGVGATGLSRVLLQDFTFSDGTTVPAKTLISVSTWALQRDDTIYPDANEFNPFRFYHMRNQDGEGLKHQLVTPTSEWVLFGQGRHACPGRFFASAELKALMAHVLLNYDVKFPNDSREFPPLAKFLSSVGPNQTAKILFRKRRSV